MKVFTFRQILIIPLLAMYCVSVTAEDVDKMSTENLQQMKNTIDSELEFRGVSMASKRERIQKSESNLKKIVNKQSIKSAVIGGVLAAAATAHPIGLLVGGGVGGLMGKSKRYDEAEQKFAELEQQIIVDEDDFLTEEEMQLSELAEGRKTMSDSGIDDDDIELYDDMPNVDSVAGEKSEWQRDSEMDPMSESQPPEELTSLPNLAKQRKTNMALNRQDGPDLSSCYRQRARREGDKTLSRDIPAHCFYMMY